VTARALARRYAQALFDVTRRTGAERRAADDLRPLADAIASHAELRQVFETPTVPVQKKTAIVEALLAAAGDVTVEVRRLMLMLAERDRLMLVPDLAAAYAELALASERIMPADVVTAAPLDEASRAALVEALGRATGAEIRMTERVDPEIIGGMVARVGSVVFDASLTHQLERLRQSLRSRM
jgi:F-type H+-transporting ATPase subunit delta